MEVTSYSTNIQKRIVEELNSDCSTKVRIQGKLTGQIPVNTSNRKDDAVLIANSEDNLQRLLHKFNITSKKYNMTISAEKTKCLTISKEPIRCKLETDDRIIEQTMAFNYLGVEITSHRDLHRETTTQVRKVAVVSRALKDIIWRNKYLRKETKTRNSESSTRHRPKGIRPPGRPPKQWRDCRVSASPEDSAQ
ncbi:hypothetical protein M0802_007926 [Mischocyttarus mexicanus]|nr:hypothetical protein M0802_007926 [Mischocyttarus mexicanus]